VQNYLKMAHLLDHWGLPHETAICMIFDIFTAAHVEAGEAHVG
jgi:hypothetical protein